VESHEVQIKTSNDKTCEECGKKQSENTVAERLTNLTKGVVIRETGSNQDAVIGHN
jgi:hypothetical protein